jgi:hypothetical protein
MKKSILGTLVISVVFSLSALAGCDTAVNSDVALDNGLGVGRFSGETISRSSAGDDFDAAVWQTTDGKKGMWNKWDFTANNNTFIFTHHMDSKDTIVGTFSYTLSGATLTTYPAIPNSGATYSIIFNLALNEFTISPQPYSMGGSHFVKQ